VWVGRILEAGGQLDQALDQFRKTLELDPNFFIAHYRLGALYEEKRMYDEAISEFKQVIKLSNGNPLGAAALARAYALAGKQKKRTRILMTC
jgi:tetratricopeptide (TPR) repeat protein